MLVLVQPATADERPCRCRSCLKAGYWSAVRSPDVPWMLDNAEERAAEAPQSFFIPPAELRHELKVGDEVKLIFVLEREDGETAVERMWVEVAETSPYIGRLRNTPQLSGVIDLGDRVRFAPEHV